MKAAFHLSSDDHRVHARIVNDAANLLDDETVDVDEVALVATGGGADLLTGASGQQSTIDDLRERGVAFKQCRDTLDAVDADESDLLDGVELVPSGVGELTRLQSEGYAYLRP